LIELEGSDFRSRDTTQALHRLAIMHKRASAILRDPFAAASLLQQPLQQSSSRNNRNSNSSSSSSSSSSSAPHSESTARALALLSEQLVRQIEDVDAWGVALSFWSLGTLDHHNEQLLSALCRRGGAVLRQFGPTDCAQALFGWARLHVRTREQREFADVLLSHTLNTLSDPAGEWRAQELSNLAWAIARVGAAEDHKGALLDTLMDAVQWQLEDFNAQVRG